MLQHVQLWQGPGPLNAVLSDACRAIGSEPAPGASPPLPPAEVGITLTPVGHGRLKAVQCLLILTEVVGHVSISVDSQEVSTTAGEMDRVLAIGPSPSRYKGGPQPHSEVLPTPKAQPRAASMACGADNEAQDPDATGKGFPWPVGAPLPWFLSSSPAASS